MEKIEREFAPDGLVHRRAGEKKGFLICTYWLAENLARCGSVKDTVEFFEKATAFANDLGPLAEEAAATEELWGDFPGAPRTWARSTPTGARPKKESPHDRRPKLGIRAPRGWVAGGAAPRARLALALHLPPRLRFNPSLGFVVRWGTRCRRYRPV